MNHHRIAIATLCLALGCATDDPSPGASLGEVTTHDGLTLVARSAPGHIFVAPDNYIGQYDYFRVMEPSFQYINPRADLTDEDEAKLQDYMVQTMLGNISRFGVEIVREPGPCVLDTHLSLVDIDLSGYNKLLHGSASSFVKSFGEVTFIYELVDSTTDTAQLRFAERRAISGGRSLGPSRAAFLASFRRSIDQMISDLGKNLAVVPRIMDGKPECRGDINKSATATGQPAAN